jgi:SAM-dependent methyltransferase
MAYAVPIEPHVARTGMASLARSRTPDLQDGQAQMTRAWPDIRSTYDTVARDYAAAFASELAAKPFDRALLDDFVGAAGPDGPIWDVGCGAAGHVTRYLADRGANVVGVDLSPLSVEVARLCQPQLRFDVADMRALPAADSTLAGIVAFYSVIHLPRAEVPAVLAEFGRVLRPGGRLLIAMHGGSGEVDASDWFGHGVEVRASLWSLDELAAAIEAAGFAIRRRLARHPYPDEHPTKRIYAWADTIAEG